jgi:[protein-PII] uridylyltransferase
MNATNPDIWNSWRASLLRELYLQTTRALSRGLENPVDRQELIDDTQKAAMRLLLREGKISEQAAWEFWQTAGEDYFLRETYQDIAWQTEHILSQKNPEKALVLITDENILNEGVVTKIFVHAQSKQNIFAATTSIIDQYSLNIQSARINSTISGYTMDTFYVLDQDGNALDNQNNITDRITQSLLEEFDVVDNYSDIIRRRIPRQLKSFASKTRTSIHNDTSKEHTILEVISPDRPGFLALLARIFVEYDISVVTAKITTLGERVEDVFFITDNLGNRLSDPDICEQLQAAIITQLDAKNIDQ